MRVTLPVVYSQSDPRWGKMLLGHNIDPKANFENYGCLITSLASICTYFGYPENPLSLHDKIKDLGGFVDGGNYVWGTVSKIYPSITEKVVETPQALTDMQINEIKQALDAGLPVMVLLDYNPRTLDVDYHFSILVDYDTNDENNFSVADSLGGNIHTLKTYLALFKPSARTTIEKYIIYHGPVSTNLVPVGGQPIGEPEKSVELQPNTVITETVTSSLPQNYPQIIHKSTQWDKTVEYLELGKSPEDAFFEDGKRVIAGLKSAKTDYNNKREEAEKEVAKKGVIIENLESEISRLRNHLLENDKLHRAELEAVKRTRPDVDDLKKQYEGIVNSLRGQLDSALGEVKDLKITLSERNIEEKIASEETTLTGGNNVNTPINAISIIINILKRVISVRW